MEAYIFQVPSQCLLLTFMLFPLFLLMPSKPTNPTSRALLAPSVFPAERNSIQAVQLGLAQASGAHRWLNAFDISLQGLQHKSLPAVARAPDSSKSRLMAPMLCVHTLL